MKIKYCHEDFALKDQIKLFQKQTLWKTAMNFFDFLQIFIFNFHIFKLFRLPELFQI